MWIDPPATISAPELTDPITVTSPSGNSMVWPERTDEVMTSDVVTGRVVAPCSVSSSAWVRTFESRQAGRRGG